MSISGLYFSLLIKLPIHWQLPLDSTILIPILSSILCIISVGGFPLSLTSFSEISWLLFVKKNWDIIHILWSWSFWNVQFTDFQYIHKILQQLLLSNCRRFSSFPKETLYPLSGHSPFHAHPSPWQSLIYFLSLWVCLFWKFHINGIIQCMVFCNWFLSFSVMFSKSIHIQACMRMSFLFIPLHGCTSFCLIPWLTDEHGDCSHFLVIMNPSCHF